MAYFSVTTFQNLLLLFKNLCTISAKAINKEPTHPQAGTKIITFRVVAFPSKRTNPSPSGDENLIFTGVKANRLRTNPSPSGDKNFLKLSSSSRHSEPTHPQAGDENRVNVLFS